MNLLFTQKLILNFSTYYFTSNATKLFLYGTYCRFAPAVINFWLSPRESTQNIDQFHNQSYAHYQRLGVIIEV